MLTLSFASAASAQPSNPVSQGVSIQRFWDVESLTEMSIDLTPIAVQDSSPYYWAHQFSIRGADVGYMGLQSRGDRRNGTQGKTALFGLWGANASVGPRGTVCKPFGNEGSGQSCMTAYDWSMHHTYRLRVVRANRDARGQWWSASVLDRTIGVERQLGKIRVGRTARLLEPTSYTWTEYFGPKLSSCTAQPYSLVKWGTASGNNGSAKVYYSYPYTYYGTCENARNTANGDGTFQQEGGTVGRYYAGEAQICGGITAPYSVNGKPTGFLFFGARSYVTPPQGDEPTNTWTLDTGQKVEIDRKYQCPYGH